MNSSIFSTHSNLSENCASSVTGLSYCFPQICSWETQAIQTSTDRSSICVFCLAVELKWPVSGVVKWLVSVSFKPWLFLYSKYNRIDVTWTHYDFMTGYCRVSTLPLNWTFPLFPSSPIPVSFLMFTFCVCLLNNPTLCHMCVCASHSFIYESLHWWEHGYPGLPTLCSTFPCLFSLAIVLGVHSLYSINDTHITASHLHCLWIHPRQVWMLQSKEFTHDMTL